MKYFAIILLLCAIGCYDYRNDQNCITMKSFIGKSVVDVALNLGNPMQREKFDDLEILVYGINCSQTTTYGGFWTDSAQTSPMECDPIIKYYFMHNVCTKGEIIWYNRTVVKIEKINNIIRGTIVYHDDEQETWQELTSTTP